MEKESIQVEGKSDVFWNRVYVSVIITTFVVVTALWAFSRYFS